MARKNLAVESVYFHPNEVEKMNNFRLRAITWRMFNANLKKRAITNQNTVEATGFLELQRLKMLMPLVEFVDKKLKLRALSLLQSTLLKSVEIYILRHFLIFPCVDELTFARDVMTLDLTAIR